MPDALADAWLQVIKDSAFLDLSSPMTPNEWCKAVLLLPLAIVKFTVSVVGLAFVWTWVRVRALCPPAPCLCRHRAMPPMGAAPLHLRLNPRH